jgi:hypothetical protein
MKLFNLPTDEDGEQHILSRSFIMGETNFKPLFYLLFNGIADILDNAEKKTYEDTISDLIKLHCVVEDAFIDQ